MRLLYSDSSCGLWYNERIHKQKKLLIIYNIYIYIYILTHSSFKIMKGGPHHCLYNKTVIMTHIILGILQAREMGKTNYNLWPNLSHVFLSYQNINEISCRYNI